MDNSRYICTKDNPWTADKGRSQHPDAKLIRCIDEYCGDSQDEYHCPHCGLTFKVTVPQ